MTDMTVSKTIAHQIGGQTLFMLGAKNLIGDNNSLTFRIGRNAKGVNMVKVILAPSDTYTVKFLKVRKMEVKEVSEETDVYAEDLRTVIRRNTEMEISLGNLIAA